jgi:hypothetical protein
MDHDYPSFVTQPQTRTAAGGGPAAVSIPAPPPEFGNQSGRSFEHWLTGIPAYILIAKIACIMQL